MIPIRVPAHAAPLTVGGVRHLNPDHRLYRHICPIDDRPLADEPVTLVHVGTHPDNQKDTGWTNGAAVAVHAACLGLCESTAEGA